MQVMDGADSEIETFHERWNDGDVDAMWRGAHSDFRRGLTRKQFRELIGDFEKVLGDVQSSERESFNINTHNGVTTTQIRMRTQFANGEGLEKFTLRTQGETQKIIYYYVESPLLNAYDPPEPDAVQVVQPKPETVS
jgi:hypothetical protein